MKYGKIENGTFAFAPQGFIIGGFRIFNPTDAQLLLKGYLPVVETPMPEADEQHYAVPHWAIQNNQIVQSWTVEEIPITDEEALTRYANSITGANDSDLISAAETLIEQRIKED